MRHCKGPAQAARGTPKRPRAPLAPDSQTSTAQKKARVTGNKQFSPRQVLADDGVNVTRAEHTDGQQPDRRYELVLHGGCPKIR